MKQFLKRVLILLSTLLLVSFLVFLAFQIIPGDSALLGVDMDADETVIEALREAQGLNDSLPTRYFRFIGNCLQGDFGESTQYSGKQVSDLLSGRIATTIGLTVVSFVLLLVISIPIGLLCAKRENSLLDRIFVFLSHLFMAVPPCVRGILITLLFGITLHWFRPGAYVALSEGFSGYLFYIIFPALCVCLPKVAMTVKMLRSAILRELSSDYVRTAKSKGNSEIRVLLVHVLKNAMLPVMTFLGMVLADMLAGSIIVEQVFEVPGLGRLIVTAIANRDFNVMQATILYIATVVIFINFAVDCLYRKLDPRIRRLV